MAYSKLLDMSSGLNILPLPIRLIPSNGHCSVGAVRDQQCSPLRKTVLTLHSDIKILEEDLGDILQERKSRFKRFFSAKRHRSELQDVVNQLESAKSNYMVR